MSNVTTGTMLKWDAADTTGLTANKLLRIRMLAWTSTNAAGRDIAANDELAITDAAGIYLITKVAEAAGDGIDPVVFSPPLPLVGIKVPVLDGGELYLTLEDAV